MLLQPEEEPEVYLCASVLRVIELPVFWYLGVAWIIGVVASGSALVLDLIPGVCQFKNDADCDRFMNLNTQILTALFTAINLYALPGRMLRVWGLCGSLYGVDGIDYNGRETPTHDRRSLLLDSYDPQSFFHIPWKRRALIAGSMLMSAISQFANQVSIISEEVILR